MKIHKWRLRHLSETVTVALLAVVVGLLAGLAAVVLKTLVHYSSLLVSRLSADTSALPGHLSLVIIFLLPLVGILLTVVYVRYVVRGDIGHGLPSVLLAISRNRSKLPAKNMYTSLIASTITVALPSATSYVVKNTPSCAMCSSGIV